MNFREYLKEAKGPQKVSVVLKNLQKKFDSDSGPFAVTPALAGANGGKVTVLSDLQAIKSGTKMIVPFMVMESEEDYGDAKPTPVIELIGLVKNGNQAWKIDSENVSGAGQAAISKAVASLKGTKTFELPDQDSKKLGAAITKGRKVKDSMFPKWMKNIEPKMVEKLGMI